MRKDAKERIDDLSVFLDEQTEAIAEYSDTLVRRLIEKITVFDEMLVVEFKSGLEIQVEVQSEVYSTQAFNGLSGFIFLPTFYPTCYDKLGWEKGWE